ncbi:hypothetical protein [Flavobacterium sp. BFFFF1]|uniref:hypothetical protein n=1 Tax=Flavobacterium sp. BFFFF1 TaxID=2015557 RepID=UPI0025C03369|nr:hypothetical protein [Flavobacterium sp. BFFFF1]
MRWNRPIWFGMHQPQATDARSKAKDARSKKTNTRSKALDARIKAEDARSQKIDARTEKVDARMDTPDSHSEATGMKTPLPDLPSIYLGSPSAILINFVEIP